MRSINSEANMEPSERLNDDTHREDAGSELATIAATRVQTGRELLLLLHTIIKYIVREISGGSRSMHEQHR